MSSDLTLSRGGALANRAPARQKTVALKRERHRADFTILVVVLMVRPTGLLGESLGKARA